jgi:hypothetical protein
MSRVTNVILTAHVGLQNGSDPEIDSVNKFLRKADGGSYGEFVDQLTLPVDTAGAES